MSAQLRAQPWGYRVRCERVSRTSRIGAQVGIRALPDGVETASAEESVKDGTASYVCYPAPAEPSDTELGSKLRQHSSSRNVPTKHSQYPVNKWFEDHGAAGRCKTSKSLYVGVHVL